MPVVIGPGDGDRLPGAFGVQVKVRSEFTGDAMAVIEETLPPGSVIPPHVHQNDVWVYVLSGQVAVLVGEEVAIAHRGGWALKPRSVPHAMWNEGTEPAHIVEVLTPGGSERWFEEVTRLADDDTEGFRDACERYGIQFFPDSPWIEAIRRRLDGQTGRTAATGPPN